MENKVAIESLKKLVEGNNRFVGGLQQIENLAVLSKRKESASGQNPIAVVLGCSDSRVPVETIFDQGIGTLFVIRVAGNIVHESQLGSVEFAVQNFGTKLILVLGHKGCGAVSAAIDALKNGNMTNSVNLDSIVNSIKPVINEILIEQPAIEKEKLLSEAIESNVHHTMNLLTQSSEILRQLKKTDEILIVGGLYDLVTGKVEILN